MPEAVRGPPMATSASQPTTPMPVPSRPLRPAPPPVADWGQHSQPSAVHQPPAVLQQQQHNQHAQQQAVAAGADTRHVAATLPRLEGNPAANPFTASSPQHMSLPPSAGTAVTNGGDPGEPDPADAGNRNSMGFQITSITQSRASAEPDAYTIDESGDEDVSDTAESRGVAGGEATAGAGAVPPSETVDGVPGRLVLPLAGSPPPAPAGGLSPRELTASPGVTGAEVLPVIPTIDGFGITLVPGALETVDSHARGTAEIVQFPSEIEMDLMPTGLTVGVAPGGSPGDGDLQETWQSRFKVVKIETNVPFKRGRWQCMDYMDQPESVQSPATVREGSVSGTSSAHSSVQLTAGEHLPAELPHPAASEEAALPGLAVDDVVMSTATTPRGGEVAEPPPPAAVPEPVAAAQPSLSVPYQPGVTGPPAAGGAGGGTVGREPTVTTSAPSVYPPAAVSERSASLPPQQPPPVLVQASEPTSPEEARLTTADGVPVFSAATSALTLPDLLPNSSLLELVQGASAEAASDSSFSGLARALSTGQFTYLGSPPPAGPACPASPQPAPPAAVPTPGAAAADAAAAAGSASLGGSGAVADKIEPIDNKIEQAMDLVKSHLLLAVREEVDVLKASITKLVEKISVLERENEVLKANATPEVLAQLDTQPSQAPSPTPTPAPPPAVLQQQQQQTLPQQQQQLPLPPPPASGP